MKNEIDCLVINHQNATFEDLVLSQIHFKTSISLLKTNGTIGGSIFMCQLGGLTFGVRKTNCWLSEQIPVSQSACVSFSDKQIVSSTGIFKPNTALYGPPNTSFTSIFQPDQELIFCNVEQSTLEEEYGKTKQDQLLSFLSHSSRLNKDFPEKQDFKSLIQKSVSKIQSGEIDLCREEEKRALYENILQSLNDFAFSSRQFDQVNKLNTRQRSLRRALDYISSQQPHYSQLLISEICKAAFCSERTLQIAFKEYLDMTIKQYLNSQKLNIIRQQIIKNSGENLTDIAKALGVMHYGNFAKDYQKLFGEKPKVTFKGIQAKLKNEQAPI